MKNCYSNLARNFYYMFNCFWYYIIEKYCSIKQSQFNILTKVTLLNVSGKDVSCVKDRVGILAKQIIEFCSLFINVGSSLSICASIKRTQNFKKGPQTNPFNSKTISLLSLICTKFNKATHCQTTRLLIRDRILYNSLYDFRKIF